MSYEASIVIPYNKDRGFLDQAIKSAEGQGEIILSQSDGSCAFNINEGVKRVKTPYFVILAEDDLLTHDSIKLRLKAIKKGFRWIHGYASVFGRGYEMPYTVTIPDPTLEEMIRLNRINGGTVMYETELFREYGGFDESLWTAEEYEFHLRLMADGILPGFCDKVIFKYRRHDNQKSLGKNNEAGHQAKRQQFIKDLLKNFR